RYAAPAASSAPLRILCLEEKLPLVAPSALLLRPNRPEIKPPKDFALVHTAALDALALRIGPPDEVNQVHGALGAELPLGQLVLLLGKFIDAHFLQVAVRGVVASLMQHQQAGKEVEEQRQVGDERVGLGVGREVR
nr:hypothetical protein [Tanacetum cinerariifolium]